MKTRRPWPTSSTLLAVVLLVCAAGRAAGPVTSPLFPVEETSIQGLHAAYQARKVTVHDVFAAHLARIAAYDQQGPTLNSIITVNPKALAEADALDATLAKTPAGELPAGALWGIPVIVKDNLDAVGMPMTNGFQGWKNYYPTTDAPVVAKIKAAGGVIIAKASLSEFARGGGDNINSVLSGFARNPYNLLHATGGSSGGTGASLAASFGVVGIGTDTGGSVRMPAAHKYQLDALVYPNRTLLPDVVGSPPNTVSWQRRSVRNHLHSSTGFPTIVVPGGFWPSDGMSFGVHFLGRKFSEPTLIRLASGFEAATHHRKAPASTPALAGEKFAY